MQTPVLSRSQSNATVFPGWWMWRGCWDPWWVYGRGEYHVCDTLLGTGLAPGMWAAPPPSEVYDSTSSTGQTCMIDVEVRIPVRSMGRGEVTLSNPSGTGLSPGIRVIFLIWQITVINTIIVIMPTPSRCTGWTEVQLWQISPICHVIITPQEVLNI